MYNLFLNSNVPNELPTHNELFERLLDICHQNEISSISCETGKLRTYSLIKSNIGYENYLSNVRNVKSRQSLTKFRLSIHDLMIEVGRYKKITKSERFCPFCPRYMENEIHFLINCRTCNIVRFRPKTETKFFCIYRAKQIHHPIILRKPM